MIEYQAGVFDLYRSPFPHFTGNADQWYGLLQPINSYIERARWRHRLNYFYNIKSCIIMGPGEANDSPDEILTISEYLLSVSRTLWCMPRLAIQSISLNAMDSESYILPHNDQPTGDTHSFTHRTILYLGSAWNPTNGGRLCILDSSNASAVAKFIDPKPLTVFGMEICGTSYHCVEPIIAGSRYTLLVSMKSIQV